MQYYFLFILLCSTACILACSNNVHTYVVGNNPVLTSICVQQLLKAEIVKRHEMTKQNTNPICTTNSQHFHQYASLAFSTQTKTCQARMGGKDDKTSRNYLFKFLLNMVYNIVVKTINQELVCGVQVTKTVSVFQENCSYPF